MLPENVLVYGDARPTTLLAGVEWPGHEADHSARPSARSKKYYNIIILWDHRRICGPSLTETSLCGAYLYSTTNNRNAGNLTQGHDVTYHQLSVLSNTVQRTSNLTPLRLCRQQPNARSKEAAHPYESRQNKTGPPLQNYPARAQGKWVYTQIQKCAARSGLQHTSDAER
jgi:hypothetical protein